MGTCCLSMVCMGVYGMHVSDMHTYLALTWHHIFHQGKLPVGQHIRGPLLCFLECSVYSL